MNDYTPNGSGSGDEDQGPNPVTYAWDINNDGTYDETGETVTVSWADLTTLYNFSAGDHTVKLKVSDGDVSKDGTDTVTVRIKPPVFSVSITQNMRENSTSPTNGTITLTRTGPANSPALNNVTISIGGSATMAPAANSDYANIATTVSFAAGSLTKTIPVTIFDDSFVEGSETILVAITGGSSTTYQFDSMAAPATGTIEDTDHWRWKTFSGTPGSASPTNPWSNGDSLSFNGSVSATNNSVQTSMTGTYSTTLNGQLAMYSVSGGVNLQFEFDPDTGVITASTGVPPNPYNVPSDGPLKGADPIAWTIDNTSSQILRTATVTVSGLGVIVGGNATITAGADCGVIATLAVTTNWGIALALPQVVITLKTEIYEATP